MRGYDQYNFNRFELGAVYLTHMLGHTVVSPHELDILAGDVVVQYEYNTLDLGSAHVPYRRFTDVEWVGEGEAGSNDSFAQCMRRDLAVVADGVDAVSFLPGWERSTGSKIEAQVARWCGRDIYEHDPFSYFRTADLEIVEALTLAA